MPASRDTPFARQLDIKTQYDMMGPLTRQAIMDSPLDLHVGMMLGAAPMELMDINTGAWVDHKLAAWIRTQVVRKMGKPPEAYQLHPRRLLNAPRP